MKKIYLLIFFFNFSLVFVQAQNLVQNPSFELYDSCPNNNDCNILDAIGWSCYRSCVIYYNACAPLYNYNGIPYNAAGFQYAHTGNAYAAEYMYFPNSGGGGYNGVYNREYIGTTLLSSLIKGTKYYVTFFVSLSSIDSVNGFDCAINKIGALFSSVQYVCDSVNAIPPNRAQVFTSTIISDTLNWTIIQGSFIADSAYKYLVIGNFFTDSATSKLYFFNPINRLDTAAAYYIDDVCVSTDSTYCANWTGINEVKTPSTQCIKISPNPFATETTISILCPKNKPYSFILYNPLGLVVRRIENIKSNSVIINKDDLLPGIYFYRLTSETEIIGNGKLIIE